MKLKPRQQMGGELLITNHLDQSLWRANWKYWAAVRSDPTWTNHYDEPIENTEQQSDHIYCTLVLEVHTVLLLLLRATACNYAEPKPISWAKPAHFHFSSSNFNLRVTYWAPLEMLFARLDTGNWYPPTYLPAHHVGWMTCDQETISGYSCPHS